MGAQEELILKRERKEDTDHKVYSWEPGPACKGKQMFPGEHQPHLALQRTCWGMSQCSTEETYLLGCGVPSPAPPCCFGREHSIHHTPSMAS